MSEKLFSDSIELLTFQQHRILKEHEMDMNLWGGVRLKDIWPSDCDFSSKKDVNRAYDLVIKQIEKMRSEPADYSLFSIPELLREKVTVTPDFPAPQKIMGRCPCPKDGELTRCCNLRTLDAVQQCAYGCAYCSIQSFYSKNNIKVVKDLDSYLENLSLEEGVWHIGTGQSSDSLFFGDDYGTLSALSKFAYSHPDVVIELKTKSARKDWVTMDLPRNIVATWSINAKTIVEKEEHLTASAEDRIESAVKASEHGKLVGFHIHPMVYFKGWKDEYKALVDKLCSSLDPEKVVMTGIGTLTFTKQNLRVLREGGRPTLVTKMPLSPAAGKYSYPLETKKEMFSYLYSLFPQAWKDKVFFYLCMEDPSLWKPCLGREYSCNADFDTHMRQFYFAKILSSCNI
ncbi:MAG: DNA photolyase [Sphaerochaetaceae bacterium]|nr:DNA photolyase [Sphaerochaetaceae bacterium]